MPSASTAPTVPEAPSLDTGRLHALDALRGIMMMLGILLHAAIPYSTMDATQFSWYFKDAVRSPAFDAVIIFIHAFRIPLFFLLSGFFAHLVLTRKGEARFVRGRARRILLPFLGAFLLLSPLVDGAFAFALAVPDDGVGGALPALADGLSPDAYAGLHLMHLWFLYYLLLVYALALAARRLALRFPRRLAARFARRLAPRFARRLAPQGPAARPEGGLGRGVLVPVFALLPFFLYFMQSGAVDTPTRPLPLHTAVLGYYGIWFAVGWRFGRRPRYLADTARSAPALLATGLAFLIGHLWLLDAFYHFAPLPAPGVRVLNATVATGAIAGLSFGILGMFVRLFPEPSRTVAFLGDASYWTYLAHLPVVVLIAGSAQALPLSPFLKYPLVVTVTSLLVLGSYAAAEPGIRVVLGLAPASRPAPTRRARRHQQFPQTEPERPSGSMDRG